jgi:hypothetical protein
MTKQIGAVTLLMMSCFCLMSPLTRRDSHVNETPHPDTPHRKLALLIGINKYKYSDPKIDFYNLHGCLNDIHKMRNLLIGKFQFKPDDVKMLANEQATHDGILNTIRSFLIDQTNPGDIVVIHFSGHGSQASDPSKINQLDETIVPYDSRDPQGKVSDITGDELAKYVSELSAKTKFVTVILDSCHSGDLIGKGLQMGQARSIPPDRRKLPQGAQVATKAVEGFRRPNTTFAFIAAARSDETAKEYTVQGQTYGALTYFFTQEVAPAAGLQTYQDVIGAIATDVVTIYPDQHVNLAGINKDSAIFSDTSVLAQPFVEVSSSQNGKVTLHAGAVHGVTVGSLYAIYAPQTKSFDSASPVDSANITDVSSFESTAALKKDANIQQFSRAVEKVHKYPDQKLKLFLQSPERSQILQSVQAKLSSESNLEVSTDAAGCKFRVADEGDKVAIYAADAKKILSSIKKTPSTEEDLLHDIGLWAKWYNILSVNNLQPGVEFRATIVQDHTRETLDDANVTLRPEDKFRLSFENLSGQSLYLTVLNLGDNGQVKVVYRSNSALPPAAKFTSYEFKASLPAGRSSVTDILKIFATDQPTDFSFLSQEATIGVQKGMRPRGSDTPLGQLLAQAGLGYHRDVDAVPSDWVATSRTITTRTVDSQPTAAQ